MKRSLALIIGLTIALALAGCSGKESPVDPVKPARVQYIAPQPVSQDLERLIVAGFSGSTVPWLTSDLMTVRETRLAIKAQTDYMERQLSIDGTMPADVYTGGLGFVTDQYRLLAEALNRRIKVDGAVSDEIKALYEITRNNVIAGLNQQQAEIAAATARYLEIPPDDIEEEE